MSSTITGTNADQYKKSLIEAAHEYSIISEKVSETSRSNSFLPLVDFSSQREHDKHMQLLEKCLVKENYRELKLLKCKNEQARAALSRQFANERRHEQQMILQMIHKLDLSPDQNEESSLQEPTELPLTTLPPRSDSKFFMLMSNDTSSTNITTSNPAKVRKSPKKSPARKKISDNVLPTSVVSKPKTAAMPKPKKAAVEVPKPKTAVTPKPKTAVMPKPKETAVVVPKPKKVLRDKPVTGFARYSENHKVKPETPPRTSKSPVPCSSPAEKKESPPKSVSSIYADPFGLNSTRLNSTSNTRAGSYRTNSERMKQQRIGSRTQSIGSRRTLSVSGRSNTFELQAKEPLLESHNSDKEGVKGSSTDTDNIKEGVVSFLQDEACKIKNAKDEEEALERAVAFIQKVTRGHFARKYFQRKRYDSAVTSGVLGAMPGTIQGRSGWYQDHRSLLVYNYEVTQAGRWIQRGRMKVPELILTNYQMNKLLDTIMAG